MARRAKVVVRFDDGTVKEFNPNRPRFLLDMEKRFGVQTPERHEHVVWLAHHALGKGVPFDDWVDTIEEMDSIVEDDESKDDEGKDQS